MFGSFTKLQGGVAMADAHAAASCIGFEASEISPHGSSDEFPGGVPEVNRLLRDLGLPHGAIFSAVAKLHEGSHEACDEATE
jgi:sugar phosphate isomerase/epimerase